MKKLIASFLILVTSIASWGDNYLPPTDRAFTDGREIYTLISAPYDGLKKRGCVYGFMFFGNDYALAAISGLRIKKLQFFIAPPTDRSAAYYYATVEWSDGVKLHTAGCELK